MKVRRHQAGDGQIQDVDALGLHQSELHVPCSLQAHEDVEQHRQEDVLLDDVGWQAKARPVEAHVEVAVAVEVIRTCLLPRAIIKHQRRTYSDSYDTRPLKTWRLPTAWMTIKRISKMALRVRPKRSLEILMFFAEKMVAHTS